MTQNTYAQPPSRSRLRHWDHRRHFPNGTVTDLGAGYSNDPRPGVGQAQYGRRGRKMQQRGTVGKQALKYGSKAGSGAGTGHASIFTMKPSETAPCQTNFSGRWRPQRAQLNDGRQRDRHEKRCNSGARFLLATSGQRKLESRGFSTTQRQMSSCRPTR